MDSFIEQLDMLDIVLAVFFAVIGALWFGRGKSLKGLLTGAVVGGIVKPALFTLFGFVSMAALFANEESSMPQQTQAEQDAVIKFWTK
jgi:dolichol kinase